MGELASIACAFGWALAIVMFKRFGEAVPAFALNLLKCSVALLLLIPTMLLFERAAPDLRVGQIMVLLLSGLIGIAIADTLYLQALKDLGATRAAIIGNLFSPFVISLSFVFLGERMTLLQGAGFALVMGGVVLVNAHKDPSGLQGRALLRGVLLGCLAIALMAVGIVMVKRLLETESFLWITTLRLLGGWLGLVIIYGALGEFKTLGQVNFRLLNWPMLVVAGALGSYVSMMLWLAGYKYANASIASVLNESASVFIVLLAWLWLKESLTRRKLIGMGLTAAGIALMLVR